MSRTPPGPGPADAADDGLEPAEVLGEVWPLLDELPRAVASSRLTATTIEMAAVSIGREAGAPAAAHVGGRRLPAWAVPLAVVAGALGAGMVAGRMTAPVDVAVLEHRAIVRHLDLLLEAGSEAFLEALAARQPDLPMRGLLRTAGEMARRSVEDYTTALGDLRTMLAADRAAGAGRSHRAWLEGLPLDERVEFEKSAAAYRQLSRTQRDLLAGVAAALADPDRPELAEAALMWHLRLSAVRPTDRPEIIGYGTDKRLAWIDWYAARLDPRSRPGVGGPATDRLPRDWERRERWPPGGFRPGMPTPVRPEAVRPEAVRPEAGRPEAVRPEAVRPEAVPVRPEAGRPDAGTPAPPR